MRPLSARDIAFRAKLASIRQREELEAQQNRPASNAGSQLVTVPGEVMGRIGMATKFQTPEGREIMLPTKFTIECEDGTVKIPAWLAEREKLG